MQGRQNLTNTERKGPHKSMHCKFCKPPGVITPEKPSGPLLETKTKVHLAHETADIRLCNTSNEPGFPVVENEACICVLEGENACPKCVPDKTRSPPKKKVCRCPKGAKPHPSMYLQTAPKQKKPKHEDNEFWWEKYSREHDLIAQETWKAYMAQRRKDKKLEKIQKRKKFTSIKWTNTRVPDWYQKFSCQQMTYLEFLSTAIRLDSDENITDRTFFVLAGIGLFPRPKRKMLKKCLSYCRYNAIHFLTQLHMLIRNEDPLNENEFHSPHFFTWNEKLIMNCVCYLEFPAFLREIMDRLPPLPRAKILPQIPYPVFESLPKKKYDSPYEEPIWQDRLNWVEKMKIDRLNRCRAHMETKRVKIPRLALVRRPSLIDARPPFLAQIEANEIASRRLVKEKEKKPLKKHPITTFNSSVDVTAIAGIEASEISGTEKEDEDELCVFLRGSEKQPEVEVEVEMEEELDFQEKEMKMFEPPKMIETQVDRIRPCADSDEFIYEREEIPFKTPPKTMSGTTIASPCPPPYATPGPPAPHFEVGKRELDIINEEICGFFPYVSDKDEIGGEEEMDVPDQIEMQLKSAAKKLKEYLCEPEGDQEAKKIKTKKRKTKKRMKRKTLKVKESRTKRPKKRKRPEKSKTHKSIKKPPESEAKEEGKAKAEPTPKTPTGEKTRETSKSRKASDGTKSRKTSEDRKVSEGARSPKASEGGRSRKASEEGRSRKASEGNRSRKASEGNRSRKASEGNRSRKGSEGNRSRKASEGNRSRKASEGGWSRKASEGSRSRKASEGTRSRRASEGGWSRKASEGGRSWKASDGGKTRKPSNGGKSPKASDGKKWHKKPKNHGARAKPEGRRTSSDVEIYSVTVNLGEEEEEDKEEEELEEMNDKEIKIPLQQVKPKSRSQSSVMSDPDADSDDLWLHRPPCPPEDSQQEEEENLVEIPEAKPKKGKKLPRKLSQKRKGSKNRYKIMRLREGKEEYRKKIAKVASFEHNSLAKEREEEKNEKVEEKETPKDVFRGDVQRLVADIVKDLAEEGFHCATFPAVSAHPDVIQLITHLRGEILTKNLREILNMSTKVKWSIMPPLKKFPISELGLSARKMKNADWDDKKWISRLAKHKTDQFYFKVACTRAEYGMKLYKTLYQSHYGTDRFLNIFFAYMISKYEDAILRGPY